MVYGTRSDRAERGGYGRVRARLVFTVLGMAALLVGAVLNWQAKLAGNKLTLRSLIQDDFTTRSDVLRTVAAASAVIAIVALLGLLDRTGWLTRLAGLAAVVVFAMFAVQVYRHYGENFTTSYHALRPGAWFQLGAGVLLLLGGLIRYRRRSDSPALATKAATTERETERELVTTDTSDTVVERPVPTVETPLDETVTEPVVAGEPTWRDKEQRSSASSDDTELDEQETGVREPVRGSLGS
jgi:hypothetical protein